jgi:chromate transporter
MNQLGYNSIKQKLQRLLEVFAVFATLGSISFGGPAAHIALMERELVQKRNWLDRQSFLDLLSLSQLIPGPNSTELAIHIGYRRAGWGGLIVAGIAFIVPAMLIVALLAYLYQTYAMLPAMQNIMFGIKPVIVAIIIHSVWLLAKSAVKNRTLAIIAMLSYGALVLGWHELLVIAVAGIGYLLLQKWRAHAKTSLHPFSIVMAASTLVMSTSANANTHFSLSDLFLTFLKIGAVLYGSGYVLIAFLQNDFVERFGVLSQQQLIDAVTIGQFTPGPLFTTATFIGYLTHGFNGAWLATLAIFLPAFVFVALIAPWSHQLRKYQALAWLLDGINVASLAFIAFVSFGLFQHVMSDWQSLLAVGLTLVLLLRFSWNAAWYVLAGGLIGFFIGYL